MASVSSKRSQNILILKPDAKSSTVFFKNTQQRSFLTKIRSKLNATETRCLDRPAPPMLPATTLKPSLHTTINRGTIYHLRRTKGTKCICEKMVLQYFHEWTIRLHTYTTGYEISLINAVNVDFIPVRLIVIVTSKKQYWQNSPEMIFVTYLYHHNFGCLLWARIAINIPIQWIFKFGLFKFGLNPDASLFPSKSWRERYIASKKVYYRYSVKFSRRSW